jgi:hypothetical protein
MRRFVCKYVVIMRKLTKHMRVYFDMHACNGVVADARAAHQLEELYQKNIYYGQCIYYDDDV